MTGLGVWKWPMNSRKAHWYRDGESRSACRSWLYTGRALDTQDSPEDKPGSDECAACWHGRRQVGLAKEKR